LVFLYRCSSAGFRPSEFIAFPPGGTSLPEQAVAPHLELREGEGRDIQKAIDPGVTRITE